LKSIIQNICDIFNKGRGIVLGIINTTNKHLSGWLNIIKIIFSNLFGIITNPSFVMFAVIALGLGTMGVWISIFNNGLVANKDISEQLENLSVFTFCIATLGSMAAEYFFEEKEADKSGSNVVDAAGITKIQSKHLAFFLWAQAVFFSFYALNHDSGIWWSIGSTILIWAVVNIQRPKFQKIKQEALDNLSPDLSTNNDDDFEGEGL
jgi:hypothetical protein